jgi:hypothetical protein
MRRHTRPAMGHSECVGRTRAGRRFVTSLEFRHYWLVVDAGFPSLARYLSRKGSGPVDGKGERGEQHRLRHARDAIAHGLYTFSRRPGGPVGRDGSRSCLESIALPAVAAHVSARNGVFLLLDLPFYR